MITHANPPFAAEGRELEEAINVITYVQKYAKR